tara:strand:+ start:311 stop:607 length:297 start_codon:yes stop_codon:yes gene_type:complete
MNIADTTTIQAQMIADQYEASRQAAALNTAMAMSKIKTRQTFKIRAGLYAYRGYLVEDMSQWDRSCKFWNVTQDGETSAHDSENTLRQAVALIDFFEK